MPVELTLADVLAGAARATKRVSLWPQWKRDLSIAQTCAPTVTISAGMAPRSTRAQTREPAHSQTPRGQGVDSRGKSGQGAVMEELSRQQVLEAHAMDEWHVTTGVLTEGVQDNGVTIEFCGWCVSISLDRVKMLVLRPKTGDVSQLPEVSGSDPSTATWYDTERRDVTLELIKKGGAWSTIEKPGTVVTWRATRITATLVELANAAPVSALSDDLGTLAQREASVRLALLITHWVDSAGEVDLADGILLEEMDATTVKLTHDGESFEYRRVGLDLRGEPLFGETDGYYGSYGYVLVRDPKVDLARLLTAEWYGTEIVARIEDHIAQGAMPHTYDRDGLLQVFESDQGETSQEGEGRVVIEAERKALASGLMCWVIVRVDFGTGLQDIV